MAEQLREAIRKCEVCIFITTRESIAAGWCLAELGAFWGAVKKVFLFMGEAGLSDSDLPKQFRGSVWTSDASVLIEKLKDELNQPMVRVHERPGNVYWLGHDLAQAIAIMDHAPENRKALQELLLQGLHHLSEIGVTAGNATDRLLSALALTVDEAPLSESDRPKVREFIRQAKEEIGDGIKRPPHQLDFNVFADEEKWKDLARRLRPKLT